VQHREESGGQNRRALSNASTRAKHDPPHRQYAQALAQGHPAHASPCENCRTDVRKCAKWLPQGGALERILPIFRQTD